MMPARIRPAAAIPVFAPLLLLVMLLLSTPAAALDDCPVGSKVTVEPGARTATAIAAGPATCKVQFQGRADRQWVHRWQITGPAAPPPLPGAGADQVTVITEASRKMCCMWTTTAGHTVCTPIAHPGVR